MRRTELLHGIRQVQEAFEASNLIEMLNALLSHSDDDSSTLVSSMLQSLNTYSIYARDYNAAAIKITDIFGLEQLQDPAHWSQFVLGAGAMDQELRTRVQTLQSRALIVKHYLPKIVGLFEIDAAQSTQQLEKQYGTKQVLTVVILEEARQFSSPERLSKMLSSIDTLYEVCATLEGCTGERLSVVACDSGEDKSFDFVGAAPAIDRLKQLVLNLWNRVVFHRNEQLSHRLDMVSHNLPILREIDGAEDEGAVGPEQAELMRRRVLEGTKRFLESGAIIPEIEQHTQHDPRHLMRPATKMLVSPSQPGTGTGGPRRSEENVDAFLDESERAELLRLFRRAKGEDPASPPPAPDAPFEEAAEPNGADGGDDQLVAEAATEMSRDMVDREGGDEYDVEAPGDRDDAENV